MTHEHDNDFAGAALNSQTSAGRLIAEARQASGLEQSDLAHRLRLDDRVIRAIERDDFGELAGATFIKGYIRAIAKELTVDPEPILEAYRSQSGDEVTPALSDFESRPPAQISSSSAIVKSASYALVAILLVLILIWWRSLNLDDSDKTTEPIDIDLADSSPHSPLPYEFSQVIHPDDPFYTAPDAPAETPTEPSVEAPLAVTEDPMSEADSAVATASIELSTDSEAWVEISDPDGVRLQYGTVRSDQTLRLSSRQPVSFIIGNTPSVRLQVNGAPVDLNAFAVEGVAKFSFPLKPGE